MKKEIISLILALAIFVSVCSTSVYATSPAEEITISENCNNNVYIQHNEERTSVSSDNFEDQVETFNIPTEVAARLAEIAETTNDTTQITLIVPSSDESGVAPCDSSGWGSTYNIRGYTLKDWVITIDDAFYQTSIIAANSGQLAADFTSAILVYSTNALLDTLWPFASAATTLADFVLSASGISGSAVASLPGDKASAAPKYIRREYFTYVETVNGDVLGCRSYCSTLEEIAWYYYSEQNHQQYQATKAYYDDYYSPAYTTRLDKAIQWHTTEAYLDTYIYIKIGTKTFYI